MNEGYRFEEENFEGCYWTNNSPVNPGGFWEQMNEDLMPQDHFWIELHFGYSGQILNITAKVDINIQNTLTEEMHDSILQIHNSLQNFVQKFKNDMQKLEKKLSKPISQNFEPKVVVQKKSRHSYATKPKGVQIYDDDSRSNSSLPSKIHIQKVVHQEQGLGATFLMRKNQFSRSKCVFPRVICQIPISK